MTTKILLSCRTLHQSQPVIDVQTVHNVQLQQPVFQAQQVFDQAITSTATPASGNSAIEEPPRYDEVFVNDVKAQSKL